MILCRTLKRLIIRNRFSEGLISHLILIRLRKNCYLNIILKHYRQSSQDLKSEEANKSGGAITQQNWRNLY